MAKILVNNIPVTKAIKQYFNEAPPADASPIGIEMARSIIGEAKRRFMELDDGGECSLLLIPCIMFWNEMWGNPFSSDVVTYLSKTPPGVVNKRLGSRKRRALIESQQPKLNFGE